MRTREYLRAAQIENQISALTKAAQNHLEKGRFTLAQQKIEKIQRLRREYEELTGVRFVTLSRRLRGAK